MARLFITLFALDVTEEEVRKRIAKRRTQQNRVDDEEEKIEQTHHRIFYKNTQFTSFHSIKTKGTVGYGKRNW